MITPHRPNFDDIRNEQWSFIGPPAPPQIPKFTPITECERVYKQVLDNLAERIAAEASAFKGGS